MESKEKLDVLALNSCGQITEAYLDTCQASMMELLQK